MVADKLAQLRAHGVKVYKEYADHFEVEFFEAKPAAQEMSLAPQDLAKILSDDMPPDSAMLFAATEDPNPENPIRKQPEASNDA